jgi:hypothetical protein
MPFVFLGKPFKALFPIIAIACWVGKSLGMQKNGTYMAFGLAEGQWNSDSDFLGTLA